MDFELIKFDPTKAELVALAEKAKGLTINGVDDIEGYEAVHKQRVELKTVRVKITKTGKEAREKALDYQRRVIAYEKELIALIEPLERELQAKQEAIDEEKERAKRVSSLPFRHSKLVEINADTDDNTLLGMDDNQFLEFFNLKYSEYLAEKERKQQQEQAKIDAENKRIEEEKRLEVARQEAEAKAKEQAAKDAELAKIKAEQEKEAAVQAERAKIEAEKKAEADKKAREEKEEADRQAKLEKDKKYQKFLKDNGYTNDTEFYIQRSGDKVVLFKKVGELEI